MVFNSKRRGLAMNGLSDACFCHGTSGIAHIFNRFYLETKVPDFNSARQYWINETIKKADFENTECVFKTWESSDMRFQNDFGLLNGITGVGLTLLGFLSDNIEDLSWDKSLLLS
jgi:lantibiotic modifying enzyme